MNFTELSQPGQVRPQSQAEEKTEEFATKQEMNNRTILLAKLAPFLCMVNILLWDKRPILNWLG